jgi:hypothetical protein
MVRWYFAFALFFGLSSSPAFASLDAGLLALVPPHTQVIASVDVARARDSQFGQFLLARLDTNNTEFQRFLAETGFDPRRDLEDFISASGGASSNTLVLARGNFDLSRIEAAARAHGASVESYRGVRVILNTGRRQDSVVAFPASGIAVMGDLADVEGVIRNKNTATSLDPALQQLIAGASSNDAWFASLSAGALASPDVMRWNRPAGYAVQLVTQAAGGVRLGDPIFLNLDAFTNSTESAASLAAALRVLASTLQLQPHADPSVAALASAFSTMKVTVNGNQVHLSVSLPEQDAERLVSYPPANRSHAQR